MNSMRKSSFGGRPSISGIPLRVRNENTDHHGHGHSSAAGKKSSTARSSSGSGGTRASSGSHSRISYIPKTSGRPSSGIGVRGRTDILKDPRPITDKRYLNSMIKQLLEFLIDNNYPHAISQKLLSSPTSKDFFKIFEFIYSRFSPGYKMVPKMEEEVPRVLKMLGYPFVLSKMYLFSVGSPHTWPHLCAALIWMMELIKSTDAVLQHGGIDRFIFRPSSAEDFEHVPEEKIVFDYCEKTYAAFMAGADVFDEQDEEVEQLLLQRYQGGSIEEVRAENMKLESEIIEMEQYENNLSKQKEFLTELKKDQQKLQDYVVTLEQHRQNKAALLAGKEESNAILAAELASLQQKYEEMMLVYQNQELSQSDIERLRAEREGLKHQVDTLERQCEGLDADNWNISMEMAKAVERTETEVCAFNRLAISLKLVPETAENANGYDYRLRTGVSSNLNYVVENNLKPVLTQMKRACSEKLRKSKKEKFQLTLENEQLVEALNEKQESLAKRQRELAQIETQLENIKQSYQLDSRNQEGELERLQQEVQQLQLGCQKLEAEKIRLEELYRNTCRIVSGKEEEVKRQMEELDDKAKRTKETVSVHKQETIKQLLSFEKHLQEKSKEIKEENQQLEEEARKRDIWLESCRQRLLKLKR